jgi:hypothetical protein
MSRLVAYRPADAPHRQDRWVRGLIHFHTRFSDGYASTEGAARIAREHGFDFLIVTDHIQDLKLKTPRTIDEYVDACARAGRAAGIPVIPGGEFEVAWAAPADERRPADRSGAHTLAFDVRPLRPVFDWQPNEGKPYDHWTDEWENRGTLAAVQLMLRRMGLSAAAAHQFQHSPLGTSGGPSDYRYDLRLIGRCTHLDFFYSGGADVLHEPEDVELITQYKFDLEYARPDLYQTGHLPTSPAAGAAVDPGRPQAVYASCDYHIGPEVFGALAALLPVPGLGAVLAWGFRAVARWYLRRFVKPEIAVFPDFAAEQLSHATYVYLGDAPPTGESILAALAAGRTVVTRGAAEFAALLPVPGVDGPGAGHPVEIHLHLPVTCSPRTRRPHHLFLYRVREERPRPGWPFPRRDVTLVDLVAFPAPPQGGSEIHFHFREQEQLDLGRFRYWYQLYIPTKFLTSPIVVDH